MAQGTSLPYGRQIVDTFLSFFLSPLVARYFAVVLSQPVIPSPISLFRCLSLDHSLFIPLDTQLLSLNVNPSHVIDSSDLVRSPFSDI